MLRLTARLVLVTLGAACHVAGPAGPSTEPPRLVVLLVIDQWPEWAFDLKRPHLHGGGFDRLLAEGEWHVGQHPSAATTTAPGHALLGTGEPPATSGILANAWWHRDVGRLLAATEGSDGEPTDDWLRAPGLGESVAAAHTGARAVSIALKERAAILMLGHAGLRLWYDGPRGAWTTFGGASPAWVRGREAAVPLAARVHASWVASDPAELARLSGGSDSAPGEIGEEGFGAAFPHDPDKTPSASDAVFATPLGNDLVLEMATAALAGEHLGADAVPDLLALSLSAHDYVGHGWGQESWEMWDMELRLDRALAGFLTALDVQVGAGKWALIVTSDHGVSPMPERTPHGGRLTYGQLAVAANRAASAELGPGEWVADARYPTVYLSAAALALPAHERDMAVKKIVFALRSFPGLARVERTADVAGHCETRTGDDFALCLALDPERSGEIAYVPAPGWVTVVDDEPEATAHGSLHSYDREVPVIMLPPGRVPHAPLAIHDGTTIQMVRIATVLARWLGVTPPTNLRRHR